MPSSQPTSPRSTSPLFSKKDNRLDSRTSKSYVDLRGDDSDGGGCGGQKRKFSADDAATAATSTFFHHLGYFRRRKKRVPPEVIVVSPPKLQVNGRDLTECVSSFCF